MKASANSISLRVTNLCYFNLEWAGGRVVTKSVDGDAAKVIACDLVNERCVFITFSDNDSFIFDSRFL
jgi:hypothetical protein